MVAVIPRSAWGARYPDGAGAADIPFTEWWLHHSVTIAPDLEPPFEDEHRAMRTLELIGQQRFKQGISYTFPIMPNGRVYQGHSTSRQGAHTGGRNDRARAICFVGNYDVTEPTDAQIEAAAQLMVQEHRAGRATRHTLNGGHRDLKQTACPGRYAYAAIDTINARADALWRGAPARPIEEDDVSAEEVWSTTTKNPKTGSAVPYRELLWAVYEHSLQGRKAAEQAKAVAEASAKADGPLTDEEVARIADATAERFSRDFTLEGKATVQPKPDA